MQAYCGALVQSLAGDGAPGPQSTLAAEVAMETATRLVEGMLAEATEVLAQCGWGSALNPLQLVLALETMATSLGMDTVPRSTTDE